MTQSHIYQQVSAVADEPARRVHRRNVLQTKVDAQCDQLATELSWTVDVFEYSELLAESCQF